MEGMERTFERLHGAINAMDFTCSVDGIGVALISSHFPFHPSPIPRSCSTPSRLPLGVKQTLQNYLNSMLLA